MLKTKKTPNTASRKLRKKFIFRIWARLNCNFQRTSCQNTLFQRELIHKLYVKLKVLPKQFRWLHKLIKFLLQVLPEMKNVVCAVDPEAWRGGKIGFKGALCWTRFNPFSSELKYESFLQITYFFFKKNDFFIETVLVFRFRRHLFAWKCIRKN